MYKHTNYSYNAGLYLSYGGCDTLTGTMIGEDGIYVYTKMKRISSIKYPSKYLLIADSDDNTVDPTGELPSSLFGAPSGGSHPGLGERHQSRVNFVRFDKSLDASRALSIDRNMCGGFLINEP